MVFNHLTEIWKRVQSHLSHRGATLIFCSGTLVLGMGAVAWLSNDQSGALKASSPSLLDLLDEVGSEAKRERQKVEPTKQPKPPRAISWSSPLAKQCSGFDAKVKDRLDAKQSTLKQRRHARIHARILNAHAATSPRALVCPLCCPHALCRWGWSIAAPTSRGSRSTRTRRRCCCRR